VSPGWVVPGRQAQERMIPRLLGTPPLPPVRACPFGLDRMPSKTVSTSAGVKLFGNLRVAQGQERILSHIVLILILPGIRSPVFVSVTG